MMLVKAGAAVDAFIDQLVCCLLLLSGYMMPSLHRLAMPAMN